jgi:hypothetical protein
MSAAFSKVEFTICTVRLLAGVKNRTLKYDYKIGTRAAASKDKGDSCKRD